MAMNGNGRAPAQAPTAVVAKAKHGSQRGVFATGMAVPSALPPPPPQTQAPPPISLATQQPAFVPPSIPSPSTAAPSSPRGATGGFLTGPIRPSQMNGNGSGKELQLSQKTNPLYGDAPVPIASTPSPLSSPATSVKGGSQTDVDCIGTMRAGKPFTPNPGGGAKVMSHAEIQAILGKTNSSEKESYPNPGGGAKVMTHAEIQVLMAAKNNNGATPSEPSLTDGTPVGNMMSSWAWSHARPKKNEMLIAYFVHNNQRFARPVPVTMSAADVKRNILTVVNDPRLNPASLMVKVDVIDFYVQNENVPLHRIPLLQAYVAPILQIVDRVGEIPESNDMKAQIGVEWRRNGDIAALIGDSFGEFLCFEDEEIDVFRQRMLKRIVKWRAAKPESSIECFPEYYLGEPLLPNLPQTFNVMIYTPERSQDTKKDSMAKNLSCSVIESVNELRGKAFKKFVLSADKSTTAGKVAEDYWLKVTGQASFMFGERKVLDYDYIRVCLSKGRKIELTMVERAPMEAGVQREDYSLSFVERLLVSTPEPQSMEPFDFDHPPERIEKYRPYNIRTVPGSLKVKISGVENVPVPPKEADGPSVIFVMLELVYGGKRLCGPVYSIPRPHNANVRWSDWLNLDYKICNIPQGSRVCATLYRRQTTSAKLNSEPIPLDLNEKDTPLGWVNCGLFDHKLLLKSGMDSFRLWLNARANPIGTCVENLTPGTVPVMFCEFESFKQPIAYPAERPPTASAMQTKNLVIPMEWDKKIEEMISTDTDPTMIPEINKLLWHWHWQLMSKPHALPKLLLAVPWNDHKAAAEAQSLLGLWPPISPVQALELLDAQFSDQQVRKYAVRRLKTLEDHEVEDYLLQLTQVLKYESNHDSALARFLLKRGLRSKKRVGHSLFWHLKAEMHVPEIAERYGLLLEAYLRGCGENTRQELLKESEAITKLLAVANKIKPQMPALTRKELLLSELSKIQFPSPKFLLPLDPKLEARGLMLDRCKYMDSKKLPLWLEFYNAETIGNKVSVIFKAGDDLRQDALTLQLIRLMDKLWKKEGMDLRLQPYGAISTGDQIGMIEIVLDANTTANINKDASGAVAVFYKDTLSAWLKKHNPSKADFEKAQETFMYSCAGYCVATYVLGIGDRHNDNIMMTKFGHLFHIDFGHFLGNFKSKLGFKRERAPFIFTGQFCHVLGGKKSELFKRFVATSCQAYNILRRNANLFRNLLKMMLSTGIPELTKEEDIAWLRDHFCLGYDDRKAAEHFTEEIHAALNTKTVVINDVVHILAHR